MVQFSASNSLRTFLCQLRHRRTMPRDAQRSLMQWAVPALSTEEVRAAAFRRREECLERRRERAESFGLPWPRTRLNRKVGKPSRAAKWTELLYSLIDADCEDWPKEEEITTTPPEWWRPGLGVHRPDLEAEQVEVSVLFPDNQVKTELSDADEVSLAEVKAGLFDAEEVSLAEAELVDAEAEVVEVQTPQPKRRKTTLPSEVKSWFLEYAAIQKKRCNWDMVRTLKQARLMAPELFNDIHNDTPRRWTDVKRGERHSIGSPKLTPAMITVLSEVVDRVTRLVPLSSVTMQSLFETQLAKLGLNWRPGLSWVKEFLRSLDRSYKAVGKPSQEVIVADAREAATNNLREKMCWLMRTHDVPPERVWNIDETALKMLGSSKRGWSRRGQKSEQLLNEKNVITYTLAMCMVQKPMLAGLVFKGKTSRSLPAGDPPAGIHMTVTENHWQSSQSLSEFIGFLDNHINESTPERPWILLMDGASIHTSVETRQAIREKYSWVVTAFTPANTTYFTQPLDRAVMRSFKANIARRVSEHFARTVIASMENDSELQLDLGMSALKPLVPQWLAAALGDISGREDIFLSAWKNIVVNNEHEEAVYESACASHDAGTLFRSNKRGVVPEESPEEGACELQEIASEDDGDDDGDDGLRRRSSM
jgi:hypothetical protein